MLPPPRRLVALVALAATVLASVVAVATSGGAPAGATGAPGTITYEVGGPGRGPGLQTSMTVTGFARRGVVLYAVDGEERVVRAINTSTGYQQVVAGTGGRPRVGEGERALDIGFDFPQDVAVDGAGNLFVADYGTGAAVGDRIIRVDAATGIATTAAAVEGPTALAFGPSGDLYIATVHDEVLRLGASTGTVTRVVGTGVEGFSGDGGLATAARLDNPHDIAFTAAGDLIVVDTSNHRIRKVAAATGVITTIGGNGGFTISPDGGAATSSSLYFPEAAVVDDFGRILFSEGSKVRRIESTGKLGTVAGTGVEGYSGDGGPAPAATLFGAGALAFDSSGALFVSDYVNRRIRRVDGGTGQTISTFAGNGKRFLGLDGPAADAQTGWPTALATAPDGDLLVADGPMVRRLDRATGTLGPFAGGGCPCSSGDGGPATAAGLAHTSAIALDGAGNVYLTDGFTRIRRISAATGTITTVAGTGEYGFSGDGGPATAARFSMGEIAVDAAGSIYVADDDNSRIRKVAAPTGIVTTIAGTGTNGHTGDGGPATAAALDEPMAIALGPDGDVYFTEPARVRRIDVATGTISTIAGTGVTGTNGDGGPATTAQLDRPSALRVSATGDVVIGGGAKVRVIDAPTGVITTVAGSGAPGVRGDGAPARSAALFEVSDVLIDDGDIVVADMAARRVRRIEAPVAAGPPTDVIASPGNGQATVSWTAPVSDGGAPILGYRVTPSIGASAQTPRTFTTAATTQTITGLTNGSAHTFRVEALTYVGASAPSAASAAVTPTPATTVPGAPGTPTATAGNAQATVTWTAPTSTGGTPITGYRVTPYVGAVAQTVRPFPSTATSQVVTGLTNGTTYTFRVAAVNGVGTGANSGASNAVTPAAPTAVPAAPTGVSAVASVQKAVVQWTAPATTGGSPITGYVVTPYVGAVAQTARSFTTALTQQTIVGLTGGATYTFRVAAVNAVGTGPQSAASAPVTVLMPPTPRTPHESFVLAAYEDFLGREPTPSELTRDAGALAAGTLSRSTFLGRLAGSTEWVSAIVRDFYLDTLGRPGDTAGTAYWTAEITSGRRSVAQVAASFYASPEYFTGIGGGTNPTWVADLYLKLLGRSASSSEIAYWVGEVAATGRTNVALRFFQTNESARQRVANLYVLLLARTPSSADLAYWAPRVVAEGDIALATSLAATAEYFGRAATRYP